jgi:hypothetical protein
MRTHGGKLVNRESRFHRTAGLDAIDQLCDPSPMTSTAGSPVTSAGVLTPSGSHRGSPLTRDVHPSVNTSHPGLARAVSNPRLPPYPHPLVTQALAKIRVSPAAQEFRSMRALICSNDSCPRKTCPHGHRT